MITIQKRIKNFIQKITDYDILTVAEFYLKYCLTENEIIDLKELYEKSKLEMSQDEWIPDFITWLKEFYYEENTDIIEDCVNDFRNNDYIELREYKDINWNNSIYEIWLSIWWPNIYLTINTRWESVQYEYYWEKNHTKNLDYKYNQILQYFNIN